MLRTFFCVLALVLVDGVTPSAAQTSVSGEPHARLIVLSDIEADPDDTQSLIRLLLYSNEIDIEGLIATTSTHQRTRIAPESIRSVIETYGLVRPNLLLHEGGYPTVTALDAVLASGQPVYGMVGVGTGKDTPGSRRIVAALERSDERPLWIAVWGGSNTLAQALFTLRATQTPAAVAGLVAKLRVYTISDQDDSGHWIRQNFPNLFYIVSPGGYDAATWIGMSAVIDGHDNTSISNGWLATNIQQGHGPLGAAYPDVAYGLEGDTPSYLGLIPNGLNEPEHPDWGGWGGRYELAIPELGSIDPTGFTGGVPVPAETRPIWTNANDSYTPWAARAHNLANGPGERSYTSPQVTIWRWRDDVQNDFAARMDWTTQRFNAANHPPFVVLAHADRLTVRSGDGMVLDASGSTDPDGDSLSYAWFQYLEAGSFPEAIELWGAPNVYRRGFTAPDVSTPQTAHFILRVTDKGSPPLSRYRRVIVTILPNGE